MTDEEILPPVEAGTIDSSLEQTADNKYRSVHDWEFDALEYFDVTGLDVSDAHVNAENGHRIATETEFNIHESKSRPTSVEVVKRGNPNEFTYRSVVMEYVIEDGIVVRGSRGFEAEEYESLGGEYAIELPSLQGEEVESAENLVRMLHMGLAPNAPSVEEQVEKAIRKDAGDDAVPPEQSNAKKMKMA